mgnify:CR=1 FL=1
MILDVLVLGIVGNFQTGCPVSGQSCLQHFSLYAQMLVQRQLLQTLTGGSKNGTGNAGGQLCRGFEQLAQDVQVMDVSVTSTC